MTKILSFDQFPYFLMVKKSAVKINSYRYLIESFWRNKFCGMYEKYFEDQQGTLNVY